jgi:GT2 family glycosyltransferase
VTEARYTLETIDLARPLPVIELADDESGVGLTVRLDGQPIGFVLRELPVGATLDPEAVGRLLGPEERLALLEERIRRELVRASAECATLPRSTPSVTAVVCTHDRPALLARCLGSLVALRERGAGNAPELEILVVDNAPSDDAARDAASRLPRIRYVREPITGLDFARNRGLAEATGEFVAYFDDDVTVDPGWLEGFVEAWSAHPDAAAVTGPVLPLELVTPAQIEFERLGGFVRHFRKTRFGTTLAGNDDYPCGAGIFGTGCNMAFRRDALRSIGGFDEALDTGARLPGGGDLDIFYRLVRAGQVIVSEPRCLVLHQHRRTHEQLRRQFWTWGLGFMAFLAKSYRADPTQRRKFHHLLAWWLLSKARLLARRALGRDAPPFDLILAELTGGAVGLCGEYGRSCRRVERLRRAPLPEGVLARGGAQ